MSVSYRKMLYLANFMNKLNNVKTAEFWKMINRKTARIKG